MGIILGVRASKPLLGRTTVPGDKSISHRALMLGAIASGTSRVRGFLDGGDCQATVGVLRELGLSISQPMPTEVLVHGRGIQGLVEPRGVLGCENSGTTMRLMAGLLAGQPFCSFLTGSAQLLRRPMERVIQPLSAMGSHIIARAHGRLAPIAIEGTKLHGIDYALPVASGQVKSALLLASLSATAPSTLREPGPARDHTERMLRAMGAKVGAPGQGTIHLEPLEGELLPLDMLVPGDMSSAAFVLAAGCLVEGSDLTVNSVGINPTRTGLLEVLREMGANVRLSSVREEANEPVADISIVHSELRGCRAGGPGIVTMIDELPLLAVLATQAKGETVVSDAEELLVKETNRIATTVEELRKLGACIEATSSGMVIEGPTPLTGARVKSHGDHRIAMALTIAGLVAEGTTEIDGAQVSSDSFPGFEQLLLSLGAALEQV